MDEIKEESDEDYLSCANSCFLCLETIPLNINNSEELINSTNLFFKYLKIKDEIQAFVCANCGDNLTKFVKLCSYLEKVRLEMDYLLDSIKSVILDSNNCKPVSSVFVPARQLILWKRLEDVMNPKPQIILERLDTGYRKKGSPIPTSDSSNDYLPSCYSAANFTSSVTSDADEKTNHSTLSTPTEDNVKPDMQRISRSKRKQRLAPAPPDCDDSITFKESEDSDTPPNKNTHTKSPTTSKPNQKPNQVSEESKCSICSKTFTTKSYLNFHNKMVHLRLKPFGCPKCPQMFAAKSKLKSHMNSVHLKLKPHKCDMCDRRFREPAEARKHKDTFHLNIRPFKCTTCLKTFTKKAILTRHIHDVHLDISPYMCDVCGRSFKGSRALQIHKAIPHDPKPQIQQPLRFSCNKCEKKFSSARSLKKHDRNVHSEGRFKCDICTKSFGCPSDLKRHISSVHEKQRYHCQVPGCTKNFAQKATLTGHYRLDHPDSDFVPKPPKIANYSEKIENGEYVAECNLCKSKFNNVESIRYHMKSIHGERTFLCSECGFAAPYESRLRKHVEKMHKVDKSVESQV